MSDFVCIFKVQGGSEDEESVTLHTKKLSSFH